MGRVMEVYILCEAEEGKQCDNPQCPVCKDPSEQ